MATTLYATGPMKHLTTFITLEQLLAKLLKIWLVLLPWQTIFIIQEKFLNGVKWEYGTIAWYGSEVLLWGIFIVAIGAVIEQKIQKTTYKKHWLFLVSSTLFFIYLWYSTTITLNPEVSRQVALHLTEAFFLFLILRHGPLTTKMILNYFVIGTILPAILGLYQFCTQNIFEAKILGLVNLSGWKAGSPVIVSDTLGRWVRAYAGFANPNIFGGYLALALAANFFLYQSAKSALDRILLLAAQCLLSFALLATLSRSAILGLIMFFGNWIYFEKDFVERCSSVF